jgi:Kef-type K+ transport system membrane component KefB
MILIAPKLLGISILEAAILGTVIAAVSPAVIVPKMLHLMENNYGTNKSIPQMIMAGASVDDIFVIVLFTAFTGWHKVSQYPYKLCSNTCINYTWAYRGILIG